MKIHKELDDGLAAGALWLGAGTSSGGVAFVLVDPLDLAIFIGGAVLAILLALAMLMRPGPSLLRNQSVQLSTRPRCRSVSSRAATSQSRIRPTSSSVMSAKSAFPSATSGP